LLVSCSTSFSFINFFTYFFFSSSFEISFYFGFDNYLSAAILSSSGHSLLSLIELSDIKMDFREIRWDGMDWVDLVQDRDQWRALVNAVMNLRGSVKCWEVLEWLHNWQLLKQGSAP
jgi:hypothetical protein